MLHIDLPSRAEIDELARFQGAPAVSLYLATTPNTEDAQADRIELKNLLKAAVGQLTDADVDKRVIRSIESSVEAIIADDEYWAWQANSLAIFATGDRVRTFRLPSKLVNIAEVSDRFHLKPLLRSVTFPHHAYVLALSVGAVRLVEVSADLPPHVVAVPGLPRDFNQALGRRSHGTKDGPLRGGDSGSEHATLTRYARAIDQALRPTLKGEQVPLIVAATEPMASIYRHASSYPALAAHVIPGTADDTPDHVLAAAARKVLDEVYAAEVARFQALFEAREATGRATTDLVQTARAATFGAVDTLLVDMDAVVSGHMGDTDGVVTLDDKADGVNYDVVDEIARRVLLAGGRVVSVRRSDVPRGGDIAAILRYPV